MHRRRRGLSRRCGVRSRRPERMPAGTLVIPMTQVFATLREGPARASRPTPTSVAAGDDPPEPPYDVTAWSLGMLLGYRRDFHRNAAAGVAAKMTRAHAPPERDRPARAAAVRATCSTITAPTRAIAINRLLKDGAPRLPSTGRSQSVGRRATPAIGWTRWRTSSALVVTAERRHRGATAADQSRSDRRRASGCTPPWTGGNMDEGWTRWVLEQYEFNPTTIHNADIRTGELRQRFDAVILPDQAAARNRRRLRRRDDPAGVPRRHRRRGRRAASRGSSADGGTLITLGAASDLAIDRFAASGARTSSAACAATSISRPAPSSGSRSIPSQPARLRHGRRHLRLLQQQPVLRAWSRASRRPERTVVARYPQRAWSHPAGCSGEEIMAGRAAVVSIDTNPGRDRAVRPAARSTAARPRHVPAAVQRALPCGRPEPDALRATNQ